MEIFAPAILPCAFVLTAGLAEFGLGAGVFFLCDWLMAGSAMHNVRIRSLAIDFIFALPK
jgi:hypothetical protein